MDNEHSLDWAIAKISEFELDFTKTRFVESYLFAEHPIPKTKKMTNFPEHILPLCANWFLHFILCL